MLSHRPTTKRPWIAAILSIGPGLGHLHSGHRNKAFLFCVLMLGIGVLGAYLSAFGFNGLLTALALSLAGLAWVAWDAARLASRSEPRPRPGIAIYLLFVLALFAGHHLSKKFYRTVAYQIPADSMSPTLVPGDHVVVDRFAYLTRRPALGDIVVFRAPGEPRHLYIKRVVATTGDTVEAVGRVVLVNDEPISAHHEVTPATYLAGEEADFPEEIVPEDHVFVLGDNLERSVDSRRLGFISIDDIVGRVVYVYASLPDGDEPTDLNRIGLAVR